MDWRRSLPSLKMQDAKNPILNQYEPIQIMNTKVKVYNITWNYAKNPSDEDSCTQVSVGACPFEVWGDDDDWTENQEGFDQRIWHFFDNMDELKEYTVPCDGATGNHAFIDDEWYITSYDFSKELDLATLK